MTMGTTAKAAASKTETDAETEELVAVITAAIHTVMRGPQRIVRIREVGANWSVEGRRDIFTSHRFR